MGFSFMRAPACARLRTLARVFTCHCLCLLTFRFRCFGNPTAQLLLRLLIRRLLRSIYGDAMTVNAAVCLINGVTGR